MKRDLAPTDFRYLQRLLKETTGVILDEGKEYLVTSRLGPLCYDKDLDLSALVALARTDAAVRSQVVDLLLNHETSFFRDWKPFEGIREHLLPSLCAAARERGERTLRIWCCACSTGQEPYSLAMLFQEALDLDEWNIEITATDVAPATLQHAREGCYSALDVNRGLPSQALLSHFDQVGLQWRVKPKLRRLVEFRHLNLVDGWPSLPPFDLVLLRNVLIYFDLETRRRVFAQLQSALRRTGFLLLGSAELTMNVTSDFESVSWGRAVYFRLRGT